jgi:hypothetical protein
MLQLQRPVKDLVMTKHLSVAIAAAALFTAGSSAQASAAAEPVARKPSASQKTAAGPMKRAPMKANSTGLVLRYAAPDTLKAGQATPLRIELSGATGDGASVELRGSSPDIVVATQDGRALQGPIALARGATRTIDLLVTAPADGAHHLTVLMSQGGRVAASALPLKVGTGAVLRKTEGKVEVTPSGERVISMPAK